MSLIESAPRTEQKQKEFDGRKQDHGDAATKGQHFHDYYVREKLKQQDGALLKDAFREADEYASMTPRELERETDRLLALAGDDSAETSWSTETPLPDTEAEEDIAGYDRHPRTADGYATEAELGIKSRHDIRKEMARRVTIDVEYDSDDNGDSDFGRPIDVHYIR